MHTHTTDLITFISPLQYLPEANMLLNVETVVCCTPGAPHKLIIELINGWIGDILPLSKPNP